MSETFSKQRWGPQRAGAARLRMRARAGSTASGALSPAMGMAVMGPLSTASGALSPAMGMAVMGSFSSALSLLSALALPDSHTHSLSQHTYASIPVAAASVPSPLLPLSAPVPALLPLCLSLRPPRSSAAAPILGSVCRCPLPPSSVGGAPRHSPCAALREESGACDGRRCTWPIFRRERPVSTFPRSFNSAGQWRVLLTGHFSRWEKGKLVAREATLCLARVHAYVRRLAAHSRGKSSKAGAGGGY